MRFNILLVITLVLFSISYTLSAQVGINNTGAQPDESAMLDIISSNKGILIPRMSSIERMNISSPAKGLMVFDNDLSSFCYHDGNTWVIISDVESDNELQNLVVSVSNDTLFITDGNYVIIPGLSASNSGTPFANAGPDIVNSCQTTISLNGSAYPQDASVIWSIISGTGGSITSPTSQNTTFTGLEGETYELEYKVTFNDSSEAFDRKNVSIANYTTASVADAGPDQLAISATSTQLAGNTPGTGSQGRWIIQSGNNGLLTDATDPLTTFTGIKGEVYTLRWEHYNDCSMSSDQVIISISSTAQGVVSPTGRYYIPDERFRAYLQIAYPSIMDGDSLIVSLSSGIQYFNLQYLEIENLDGLQFFNDLILLNCTGNLMTEVPFFSETLVKFQCNSCTNLSIIPDFPNSIDTIEAVRIPNLLTMPDLPRGLKYIRLDAYLQSTFPILPESCEYVFLGLPNLMVQLNIPSMATEFYLLSDNNFKFPTLPIDQSNLERLQISNSVSTMPSLYGFNNLVNLNLSGNDLLKLELLPEGLMELSITGSPIICVENKPPGVADVLAGYDICPE